MKLCYRIKLELQLEHGIIPSLLGGASIWLGICTPLFSCQ